jgi:stearoyl-CoA desaturase (delta-9 desaturase)
MQKKRNQFLYFILYPVHVIAWMGLLYVLTNGIFSWYHLLFFLLGWILIEGVGTAIILHRYTSHRSFEIKPFLKPLLIWLSCMSLQGSPIGWAAVHRGSHHRYADTDKDAHSPIKGKWYSWHAWLIDWNDYFNPKYVVDLMRDKQQVWFAKNYELIIFVTYVIVGLISLELLLFAFMLPAAIGLYQESNINVFCHSGDMGYRNFDTKDQSRNIPLLAFLTWGQGWHNNHHHKPSSYDFGTSVSGKKEEFDPCMLIIPFVATRDSYREILEKRKEGVQLHSQQSS